MTEPTERTLELTSGSFRALEWPGSGGTAILLHGLSGIADVWNRTVEAMGPDRPRCIAIDQRGHGHSPRVPDHYAVGDYMADLIDAIGVIARVGSSGDGPVHVVGHSMGARVSMVAAARRPDLFSSAVIVDIGPEAWKANITSTESLFRSLPTRFANRVEALNLGRFYGKEPDAAERCVTERLREEKDGSFTWLACTDALIETVTVQRGRGYWRDWDRIRVPTLLVRGGTSKELRPEVAEAMRRRNGSVSYVEIPDIGHNIPMLAPDRLGEEISGFWRSLG
ncbi:MAG: alpha/beta hydrolase [Acidimicrobiales bacterium]|nr:alpha/beta hydrolase [Acidimicrobiales bacterium]MCB1247015.1 alpha/beta hydrolase [Acidimicrobiia bacterium]